MVWKEVYYENHRVHTMGINNLYGETAQCHAEIRLEIAIICCPLRQNAVYIHDSDLVYVTAFCLAEAAQSGRG